MATPNEEFNSILYRAHTARRQEHLASLGLDLVNKYVYMPKTQPMHPEFPVNWNVMQNIRRRLVDRFL